MISIKVKFDVEPTDHPGVKEEKTNSKNLILIVEIGLFIGLLILIALNSYFNFFG